MWPSAINYHTGTSCQVSTNNSNHSEAQGEIMADGIYVYIVVIYIVIMILLPLLHNYNYINYVIKETRDTIRDYYQRLIDENI